MIGALTVFLGRMGSLGLSRGIIPEVEVQLPNKGFNIHATETVKKQKITKTGTMK